MNIQRLTAHLAILGLLHLVLVSGAARAQAATRMDPKQRVEQFGEGAELKLKLKNGENLRGHVESIAAESFVFSPQEQDTDREIAYADLERVNYPHRGYKAEGTPDPVAAKRMVVQLGVGEHIMVQVSPTEKVRGHIVAIEEDQFVILPDRQSSTRAVPYNSVHKVNKNLSFGATIAILAGIAAAVVLILVLSGKDDIDVLPG
jgi:ribosome maturation factor RimP